MDLLAGGRDAVEVGRMGPVPGVADAHEITVDDEVVDDHLSVRKGRAPRPDQVDQAVRAHADGLAAGPVDGHHGRDDLVGQVVVAPGPALVVPPADISQRFGDFATPVSREILKLERATENLRRMRDLLLPRLLSGLVEVGKDEG